MHGNTLALKAATVRTLPSRHMLMHITVPALVIIDYNQRNGVRGEKGSGLMSFIRAGMQVFDEVNLVWNATAPLHVVGF